MLQDKEAERGADGEHRERHSREGQLQVCCQPCLRFRDEGCPLLG